MEGRRERVEPLDRAHDLSSLGGEVEAVARGDRSMQQCPHGSRAREDPRTRVVNADLTAWLVDGADHFDAICLDIDNGPDWTVAAGNAVLYTDEGLSLLRRRLVPGGVLAVWSAMAAPAFEAALRQHFISVQVHLVEVPRGDPDHVYVGVGARTDRHANGP